MKLRNRVLFLVFAAVVMLGWAGCGGGCPAGTGQTGSGSGGSGGGNSAKGTSCTPSGGGGGGGSIAALLYYVGTNNILGASLSTTGTFAPLTSFTPPTLASSVGQ